MRHMQQEAILRQQEALKQKLAKQKEEELFIEKQQLIIKSNAAISKNIEAYNELLDACHCNTATTDKNVEQTNAQLISKSMDEIKMYYLKSIKDLTANYMNMLSTCDTENEDWRLTQQAEWLENLVLSFWIEDFTQLESFQNLLDSCAIQQEPDRFRLT